MPETIQEDGTVVNTMEVWKLEGESQITKTVSFLENDSYLECITRPNDSGDPQLFYLEDNLRQAFGPLILMHLACVVILLIMHVVQAVNKKSYFHNILVVLSLPIY